MALMLLSMLGAAQGSVGGSVGGLVSDPGSTHGVALRRSFQLLVTEDAREDFSGLGNGDPVAWKSKGKTD